MSRTSAHASPSNAPGVTRSGASILQRQTTSRPHVCIQREASGPTTHPAAPSLVREVVESPGKPLDASTRSSMEPHLGHDLSQVRVHTDERAAESARAVSANAYTAGNHVAFGSGQYTPGTSGGQRLIAHELTHVVQQASGPVATTPVADGLAVSHPGDPFEGAASEAADKAVAKDNDTQQPISALSPLPSDRTSGAEMLNVQRADTSPDAPYTARQTTAAESSASAAQSSASAAQTGATTGIFSAAVGGFSALIGAYTAIRSANFAERSAQAAEDPPTAEPTTGGITVTDADIPEIKALDTKKIDDPTKDPDSLTVTTTPKEQDVTKTGDDVETTTGKGAKAKKTTTHEQSTTDKPEITTKSRVYKPEDKKDTLSKYKILNVNQGSNDSADFYVSIRSDKEGIKDGGTEPPDAKGYLGGSMESNASVNFKARAGQHNPDDGSATVRLLIGGTNAPPRKTLQSSGFFGGGGPKVNDKYQVQRFSAVVRFDADPEKRPPVVERTKGGIGTATPGSGKEDGDALVTVSLPDTFLPPSKNKKKKEK